MAFDPTKPAQESDLLSPEMRNNFIALGGFHKVDVLSSDESSPPENELVGYVPVVSFSASSDNIVYFSIPLRNFSVTKDIKLEIKYCMSTSEASKKVSLNLEYDVVSDDGDLTPAAHTDTEEDELDVPGTAEQMEVVTLTYCKIDNSHISANSQQVNCKLWRDVDGVAPNHGGKFQVASITAYQE